MLYGDIMFLQIVQRAFPPGMLGGLAIIGAIATGLTALLLPVALHWWFAPGAPRIVGWIFYGVDFALLVLNAVLAYQISRGQVDPVLAVWWSWCPATPLACAAGWGLCFALDPSNKLRHTQLALESMQIETVARGMEQATMSPEALAYLNQVGIAAMWRTAHDLSGQALPPPRGTPAPTALVTGQLAQPPVDLPAARKCTAEPFSGASPAVVTAGPGETRGKCRSFVAAT